MVPPWDGLGPLLPFQFLTGDLPPGRVEAFDAGVGAV